MCTHDLGFLLSKSITIFHLKIIELTAVKNCSILHRPVILMLQCLLCQTCLSENLVRRVFFYFLIYGFSDPNFCILEKKSKFYF